MKWLALIQAAYFLGTGLWPLIHIRSFMAVTGPKTDLWLVKTVGVLVSVIGAAVGMAGIRNAISPEIIALAVGAAAALTWVDVWYVTKGIIARIYLLDAVAEIVLIGAWVALIATNK